MAAMWRFFFCLFVFWFGLFFSLIYRQWNSPFLVDDFIYFDKCIQMFSNKPHSVWFHCITLRSSLVPLLGHLPQSWPQTTSNFFCPFVLHLPECYINISHVAFWVWLLSKKTDAFESHPCSFWLLSRAPLCRCLHGHQVKDIWAIFRD